MNRRRRAGIIGVLGVVAAVVAYAVDPANTADDLALLAAGLVLGELLVLRLEDRSAVPLSYAVMIVLASSFALDEYVVTIVGAELVAFFVRPRDTEPDGRVLLLLFRLAVGAATVAAYRGVDALFDHRDSIGPVVTTLACAAVAQLLTHTALRLVLRRGSGLTNRGRLAWLAIASSGMLMAIGYTGIEGKGELGIWGALLFATPLLAAWYAFERLDSATLAYRQTIESLAMAPELGGLVPAGHSERVAALVASMGHGLGLAASEVEDLEMAARLHHVGQVTLDDPAAGGRWDGNDVAAVTAGMLREIGPLARAGNIVAGDSDDPRRIAVQVLRLASEYDDLTVVDGTPSEVALGMLRSAPGYVYEERVLSALERVVGETNRAVG